MKAARAGNSAVVELLLQKKAKLGIESKVMQEKQKNGRFLFLTNDYRFSTGWSYGIHVGSRVGRC